jgi:hypothetical protein
LDRDFENHNRSLERNLPQAHQPQLVPTVNIMLNIRMIIASTLRVMLALANTIPDANQGASNDDDDFWAKKPMHTTDLMAGKARTAIKSSATHTQLPRPTSITRTLYEEMNEL